MRRTSSAFRFASVAPLLMLSACGGDDVEEQPIANDGRAASGEILPSSISDDMIEPDRLRSQPPLLSEAPEQGSTGSEPGEAASEGDALAADGEASQDVSSAEPVPASPPAPAREPALTVEDVFVPLPDD